MTQLATTNDATVSRQWATRTNDERYLDLPSMFGVMQHNRSRSRSAVVSSRSLTFTPAPADEMRGLTVTGKAGVPFAPTHWAFNQLCQRSGTPAGFLATLPAPMAADVLNYKFRFGREVEDVGLYLKQDEDRREVMAATGPNYGRIHNADIVEMLIDRVGDGVTGDWRVPFEFGQDRGVTKQNTTLYASDRDMFVFLADEVNRVTIPNRRDGKSGTLARGFAVSQSEVGAGSLKVFLWLFDYACMNRILWGVYDFKKISIRHTAGAPDRYLSEVLPAINDLRNASAGPIEETLKAAQARKVEGDLSDFLKARKFTGAEITGMKEAFALDEGRPLETKKGDATLWDAVTGLTAYARAIPFADERSNLEARAGALLDLVAVR